MPIIKFTKADVLRSRPLEGDKWYSWEISRVEGPKTNAKGDGFNFIITLSLIDAGELDGKEVMRTFSNKAIGMMLPLVAAVRGVPQDEIDPEDFNLDTDELVHQKIDGKYKIDTYEGQLVGKVEEYLPYKKMAGQTQPF
jgi:hypothetical protein